MKHLITLFTAFGLLCFSGCSERVEALNYECVVLHSYGGDVAYYGVYVITPDSKVQKYDFTSYWQSNNYSYSPDSLPPENEYSVDTLKLPEGAWARITQVLEENNFIELPAELSPIEGYDFPSYYIEVTANGNTYKSGGYGAGHNEDKKSKRFREVFDTISDCLE